MSSIWEATNDRSSWGCDIDDAARARRGSSRRAFLRDGAIALFGTSAIPAFLTRSVMAEATTAAASGQKARGPLPARRRRRPQHCRSLPRKELLRPPTVDRHQARAGSRSRRNLRPPSRHGLVQAALRRGTPRGGACRRIARHHALPFRRAGLYGVRNSGRQDHHRRLAQSRPRFGICLRKALRLPRRRPRPAGPANPAGQAPRHRGLEPRRLLRRRKRQGRRSHLQRLRGHGTTAAPTPSCTAPGRRPSRPSRC